VLAKIYRDSSRSPSIHIPDQGKGVRCCRSCTRTPCPICRTNLPELPSSTATSVSPRNVVRSARSRVPWCGRESCALRLPLNLSWPSSRNDCALDVVSAPRSAPSEPSTSSTCPPILRVRSVIATAPTVSSCIDYPHRVQVRSSVSSEPTVSERVRH